MNIRFAVMREWVFLTSDRGSGKIFMRVSTISFPFPYICTNRTKFQYFNIAQDHFHIAAWAAAL